MFNLTTKIRGFVLTRDSWILFWTKLVGLAGLVASGVIDPKAFGLTDGQQHAVMFVCSAIIATAAKLQTSPLPSKADADKVTTHAV